LRPSLIVHGGAWDIPEEALEGCRNGCRRALEAGWSVLKGGGTALDAVETAIVVLEDDPAFDAGFGSHLNRDGRVQLDAIVMDGRSLRAGAVAAVERVRNPIRLARKVLESSPHMMLVGPGAEQFAVENGLTLCSPDELISEGERAAWRRCRADKHFAESHHGRSLGTVGAVALDLHGNLASGTSTGGTCCKFPGRVGDSPLVGCGCYADARAGAVSCTGWGEAIMKIVMAKTAVDSLRSASSGSASSTAEGARAMQAAEAAVRVLAERAQGTGGLILLDREGHPGFAYNTPCMAFAYATADGSLVVSV